MALFIKVTLAGVDVFAVILPVHGAGGEAYDVRVAVADGNHQAVPIDAIQLMGFLAHLQDTHLLQQVEVQAFLLAVLDDLPAVLRGEADAHFLAVLFIPSAQHVVFCSLCRRVILPKLMIEPLGQVIIDDAHGLQFLVPGFLLRR